MSAKGSNLDSESRPDKKHAPFLGIGHRRPGARKLSPSPLNTGVGRLDSTGRAERAKSIKPAEHVGPVNTGKTLTVSSGGQSPSAKVKEGTHKLYLRSKGTGGDDTSEKEPEVRRQTQENAYAIGTSDAYISALALGESIDADDSDDSEEYGSDQDPYSVMHASSHLVTTPIHTMLESMKTLPAK